MLKDIPKDLMYVYLGGIMLGGRQRKSTIDWRYQIRKYYENWKGKGMYEICFLDPWNGEIEGEIDNEGLTNSVISAKAIFEGDKKAIQKADVIIANFNQFESKRPSVGTYFECGIALALNKPLLLIVSPEEYERWSKHPFTSQACGIYKSVYQLLNSKILNWFYKRINHANYTWNM